MEITERKNSMSSSARMDDEDEGDEGEDGDGCERAETDEDDREGTPVQKIMVDDDDVRMSVEEQVHIEFV